MACVQGKAYATVNLALFSVGAWPGLFELARELKQITPVRMSRMVQSGCMAWGQCMAWSVAHQGLS